MLDRSENVVVILSDDELLDAPEERALSTTSPFWNELREVNAYDGIQQLQRSGVTNPETQTVASAADIPSHEHSMSVRNADMSFPGEQTAPGSGPAESEAVYINLSDEEEYDGNTPEVARIGPEETLDVSMEDAMNGHTVGDEANHFVYDLQNESHNNFDYAKENVGNGSPEVQRTMPGLFPAEEVLEGYGNGVTSDLLETESEIARRELLDTDNEIVDMSDELNSDDEIAVLSKEEAERSGTFKKSSFEVKPQQDLWNAPAPVYHAGDHVNSDIVEDRKIREYFEKYSLDQLHQHEANLDAQLEKLESLRDQSLNVATDTRKRVSILTFDQVAERSQLMRLINDNLHYAESAIKRAKKVRRYKGILNSVKDFRLTSRMNPQSLFQHNYQPIHPASNMAGSSQYGSNVNPYMIPVRDDDSVYLEQLLNDIYKEEDVEGMEATPASMSVQLLDHQRRGLHWLLKREKSKSGCILADDMGLGKTVQTIALIMSNMLQDANERTTLIVGPVSLLRQWAAEFQAKIKSDFALKVGFYHGAERRKFHSFRELSKFDIILTSYTTLASEYKQHFALAIEQARVTPHQNVLPDLDAGGQRYSSPFFSSDARFYRVVLDEAQYIKNKLSQTSKAVACLKATHRICLTGTPMQNSIDELYPILRFLKARPYNDEKNFKRDITVPIKSNSSDFDDYDRNQSMLKLRAILLALMLRRTKTSMVNGKPLIELPTKTVDKVFVKREEAEDEYYKELEKGIQKKAEKLMNSSTKLSHSDILTLLLRLRQACIHQFLVEVGRMNHEEKSAIEGGNWKHMYRQIVRMTDEVRQTIELTLNNQGLSNVKDEIEVIDEPNEVQLTCPICFDVQGEDSIIVFAHCGHMICDGCTERFFEQALEGDTGKVSPCMTCNRNVSESSLVSYSMFQKVTYEGFTVERLETIYGSKGRKTTNSEKVRSLIHQHKGFFPSAKMARTLDLIRDILEDTPDEKIIIFSHFTTTFDLMGHALKQDKIPFLRYDGSMSIDLKNGVIGDFYQGSARVLLISLKAGNVGLTLTCASHVVLMDPFWNPYVEEQAMDRAHRFGQQRPVKVYRLLIKDSVEDRITDLQDRKKELINTALDESALKTSSHLGRRELGYLFGLNGLDRMV